MLNNLDAYKQIYYLENLTRDYVMKYSVKEDLPKSLIDKFSKEATKNEEDPEDYKSLIGYSHLGELFDFLKSRVFLRKKENNLSTMDISELINHRNDIMHSRTINKSEAVLIEELCTIFVENLEDVDFKRKWDRFLIEDIKNFRIPIAYVLYPFGKGYKTLIGREQELKILKENIKNPFPVSVIGHGGLGKTALVMQLIEDLIYSPAKPFENIFFFSFKDSAFIHGQFTKIDKIIQNYEDVVIKLAKYFKVNVSEDDFEEIVWSKFFETKSLLVLDNLETEIVHSNLEEFVLLAQRFIRNFNKSSRLIITSRSGLGNNETKLTLNPFSLEETKELVKVNAKMNLKEKISDEDWGWIQSYTKGNPGLINAFTYLITSTSKSIKDIRIEYNSRYTEESIQLHEQQEIFISFCFENTIECLPKISKEYLASICYICSATNLYEVNESLLSYVKNRIFLKGKKDSKLDIINFTNIGFLQPVKYTAKYRVNEFFVSYLDGNLATNKEIVNVFDLKKSIYNDNIIKLIDEINQTQFNQTLDVEEIMAEIFLKEFDATNEIEFAIKAFFSSPDLKKIFRIYSAFNPYQVIDNINFVDKVHEFKNPRVEKGIQEKIINIIIDAFFKVNNDILAKKSSPIKQSDLVNYYYDIEKKITKVRNFDISIELKGKICRFLNNCSEYDKVIDLASTEDGLSDELLTAYNKLLSVCKDDTEAGKLIKKCENIILTRFKYCKRKSLYSFNTYLLRYYQKKQDFINMEKTLREAKKYEPNHISRSIIALRFEVELLSLEYLLATDKKLEILNEQLEIIKELTKNPYYNQIYDNKKVKFNRTLDYLERKIKSKVTI